MTTRRRFIGNALREYRQSSGYTLADMASVLHCDRSKISRVETGQRGISPKELHELLDEYGVSTGARETLAMIADVRRGSAWWSGHFSACSRPEQDRLVLESAASRILIAGLHLVPDLLRTTQYARSLAGGSADERLDLLIARQDAVLGRQRPVVDVVVGEGALRQVVGGAEGMCDQLRLLSRISAEYPWVTVQVLPFNTDAVGAAGAATILLFEHLPAPGVVHVEGPQGGVFLLDEEDANAYLATHEELKNAALSPRQSQRFLREVAAAVQSDGSSVVAQPVPIRPVRSRRRQRGPAVAL